jgi:hypothetical protein
LFNLGVNTPPRVTAVVTGPQRGDWYVGPTSIRFDVGDPDSPVQTMGCEPVELTTEGPFRVVCEARSAGGTTVREVRGRRDVTPPQLTCPMDQRLGSDGGAVMAELRATATDAIDASPLVTQTPPANSVWPPGRSTVQAEARDEAGNRAECSFEVVVDELGEGEPGQERPTRTRRARPGCEAGAGALVPLGLVALWRRRRRS